MTKSIRLPLELICAFSADDPVNLTLNQLDHSYKSNNKQSCQCASISSCWYWSTQCCPFCTSKYFKYANEVQRPGGSGKAQGQLMFCGQENDEIKEKGD